MCGALGLLFWSKFYLRNVNCVELIRILASWKINFAKINSFLAINYHLLPITGLLKYNQTMGNAWANYTAGHTLKTREDIFENAEGTTRCAECRNDHFGNLNVAMLLPCKHVMCFRCLAAIMKFSVLNRFV